MFMNISQCDFADFQVLKVSTQAVNLKLSRLTYQEQEIDRFTLFSNQNKNVRKQVFLLRHSCFQPRLQGLLSLNRRPLWRLNTQT